jgi:hypothetical protein
VPKPVPPARRFKLAAPLGISLVFLVLAAPAARAQRPVDLKGTAYRLARQNRLADEWDLSRMSSATMIRRMASNGYLVHIPSGGRGFYVDSRLGAGYSERSALRYARPWVLRFLEREGGHYADAFGGARFKVTSLIRTETYQRRLARRNVNAATGDDADSRSPHLTGSTLDISKKGMSARELAWMRRHLVALQKLGWVDAIEEIATNSFHVFVTPDFAGVDPGTATRVRRAAR